MKQLLFGWLLLQVLPLSGQDAGGVPATADTVFLDSLIQQFSDFFNQGEYEQAVPLAQIILVQVEQRFGREEDYGSWLANLGTALHNAGRLEEALPYLQQGVEHTRIHLGEDSEDYIIYLSDLGMLQQDLGDYGRALNTLQEAVTGENRYWEKKNVMYGVLVNNLALAYENVGEWDQALKNYQLALELTEKTVGKSDLKYAIRLQNIASVYRKLQQYERALPLYQESLRIAEAQVSKEHPFYIKVLANLGRTYQGQENKEQALQVAREVEALATRKLGRLHYNYPLYVIDLGVCYAALGRYQEALAALTEAEHAARQITGNSATWSQADWLYTELAKVYAALGDYDNAANYYIRLADQFIRQTQTQFDQFNQRDQESYLARWHPYFARILSFSWQHPDQIALLEKAFDVNLLLKGLILDYHRRLLNSLRYTSDTSTAQAYIEWANLEKKLAAQYSLPADKRIADFYELQYRSQELERHLTAISASFREARQMIGWQDVQNALQEQEAAIEFCSFRYTPEIEKSASDSTLYLAFVLRKHDPHPQLIYLFAENELDNLHATRFLYGFPDSTSRYKTLGQLVWAPLAASLDGISKIYYTPAGLLHRINFGALPFNRTQTLSQQYRLYLVGSTRQLVLGEPKSPEQSGSDAVVFGGIDYDTLGELPTRISVPAPVSRPFSKVDISFRSMPSGAGESWPYLEWTGREAEEVSILLRSTGTTVELRKGSAATEEEFKRLCSVARSPTVVHLATHGFFFPDRDPDAPMGFSTANDPMIRSGLVLAGANRVWQGQSPLPDREDGILTAYEISLLNFHQTELVVLSACDTGLGEYKGNEGVYGLQRAFKMAGARYVLMTLWQTSDRLTNDFMRAFYREWLTYKKDIPTAFQSAQNQLKEQYRIPYNPSIWAGFILAE